MRIPQLATVMMLVLAVGCSSPPPPRPEVAARDVAADAMAAVARADWPRAAALLREALGRDPARATLHYHLGVAATHLDRRDEAIQEFQWVLANVARELPEAVEARRWLTEAGVLAAPRETAAASADRITEETVGDSGIEGQVLWADGQPTARLQIFLKGAPRSPNETLQWVMRTDENGRFGFRRIPAGTYMLTNKVAGKPTWRLRVQLTPGEVTTLDLSETNSANVRDDFPGV